MSQTTTLIQPSNKTLICSVLFLDIVEYSKKSVSGQIKLKDLFNTLLSDAIKNVDPADRIILDTGDGAAISFLSDPEDALSTALSLRNALVSQAPDTDLPLLVRIGINLGPVKLVKDINGQPNIIGDGINVAQRVMSFAEPGQILISRSYYDVVSRMSQEFGQMFHYLGSHTDKHVREHEIYTLIPPDQKPPESGRPAALLGTQESASGGRKTGASFISTIWQNKFLPYAVGGVALLLIVIFSLLPKHEQPQTDQTAPQDASSVAAATTMHAPTVASGKHAKPQTAEPSHKIAKTKEPTTATLGTISEQPTEALTSIPETASANEIAYVGLAISPWGEIFLDGKFQGVSPPLKELEVVPGVHTIKVRNAGFPVYKETIELKPNGRVKIKHKFTR